MAKKIGLFYNKIFTILFGIIIVPFARLFGFGSEALATDTLCSAGQCTAGDARYVACGTSQLQKQVCTSCTYTDQFCPDYAGSATGGCSYWEYATVNGTYWADSGSCTTYSNQCTSGQTSSRSCSNEVGSGTQTRSCTTMVVGTSTYYVWGAYGTCVYTSCAYANDVLDSGLCYCKLSCPMTNGYGTMVAQVRVSSVCPVASSSSSPAA